MSDKPCEALTRTTYAEYLNYDDLDGAGICVDPGGAVHCELYEHSTMTPHTATLQTQDSDTGERLYTWWLRWSDAGDRWIVNRPECQEVSDNPDKEDPDPHIMCLLIKDHPGDHDFI